MKEPIHIPADATEIRNLFAKLVKDRGQTYEQFADSMGIYGSHKRSAISSFANTNRDHWPNLLAMVKYFGALDYDVQITLIPKENDIR